LFYNRVSKESVREKPADYDGFYVIGEKVATAGPGAAGKGGSASDQAAKKIY